LTPQSGEDAAQVIFYRVTGNAEFGRPALLCQLFLLRSLSQLPPYVIVQPSIKSVYTGKVNDFP
jgi:hypothetical protein